MQRAHGEAPQGVTPGARMGTDARLSDQERQQRPTCHSIAKRRTAGLLQASRGRAVAAAMALALLAGCGGGAGRATTGGASGSTGSGGGSGGSLPTLSVAVASLTPVAIPLWVGMKEGLFRRNGVRLATRVLTSAASTPALAAVVGGHVDVFGGSMVQVIASSVQGAPLVVFAVREYGIPYELVAKPDIHDAGQLAGKTVGVSHVGGSSYAAVVGMLKAMHAPSSVRVVSTGNTQSSLAAFSSNQIQAFATTAPEMVAQNPSSFRVLARPGNLGVATDGNVFAVTPAFLKSHRRELIDFLNGYASTLAYDYGHPATVKAIFGAQMHDKNTRYLDANYQTMIQGPAKSGAMPLDPTPPASWLKQQVALAAQTSKTVKAGQVDLARLVDGSLMQAVKSGATWRKLWPKGVPAAHG